MSDQPKRRNRSTEEAYVRSIRNWRRVGRSTRGVSVDRGHVGRSKRRVGRPKRHVRSTEETHVGRPKRRASGSTEGGVSVDREQRVRSTEAACRFTEAACRSTEVTYRSTEAACRSDRSGVSVDRSRRPVDQKRRERPITQRETVTTQGERRLRQRGSAVTLWNQRAAPRVTMPASGVHAPACPGARGVEARRDRGKPAIDRGLAARPRRSPEDLFDGDAVTARRGVGEVA